jgi:hypothetical protein
MLTLVLLVWPHHVGAADDAPTLPRGQVYARPVSVMIDNISAAWPQSGFSEAAVVYEALAEGGITRLMFIYNGDRPLPEEIGPIRSTRVYYGQWAMGYDAVHIHAGGSPEGLGLLQSTSELVDIDGLKGGTWSTFYRKESRYAPHNLYTSGQQIRDYLAARNVGPLKNPWIDESGKAWPIAEPEIGFLYRGDGDAANRPAGQTINYYFIGSWNKISWSYDPVGNRYLRTALGKVSRDANTKSQVSTKNLIIIEAASSLREGDEKDRIDVGVTGSGRAKMFQDGLVLDIEWRKPDASSPMRFYYLDGVTEVALVEGAAWIAVVPSIDHVSAY